MHNSIRSFEYKNEYFYIVIRQLPQQGPRAYAYCCGIKISRFDPICWGKAGICSNPAFKGLQLLRADASQYAIRKGIRIRNAENIPCSPMTPRGDGWYRESPLLIEDASPKMVQAILEFSVMDLVKTVLSVCSPDAKLPVNLPNPPGMQNYLDSLSIANYKQKAPPPIAKPQM